MILNAMLNKEVLQRSTEPHWYSAPRAFDVAPAFVLAFAIVFERLVWHAVSALAGPQIRLHHSSSKR